LINSELLSGLAGKGWYNLWREFVSGKPFRKAAMKNKLIVIGLACAVLNASDASARPLRSIAITNSAGLAFGSFVAGAGGTVTVSPLGVRTNTGGVVLIPAGGGAAASFNVVGRQRGANQNPNHTHSYSITLPANGTVTITSGANSMAVNNFVSNPPAGNGTGTLAVGTITQTLTVGARLTVAAGQAPGSYSGTFNVTVVFP
jgi:Domain of unknown function (DUF4402)